MPISPGALCAGLLISLLTLAGRAAPAEAGITVTSGPARVALLELYTSEGCSSCPPADKWLSGLQNDARLWHDVVPVAFHVDYWDYIGWKDRFAESAYSDRQRRYAEEGGLRVVYTPGLILNGEEWRMARGAAFPGTPGTAAGTLQVTVGDKETRIQYRPIPAAAQPLRAQVAWLGFDLTSTIKAGENRGRQLEHDFVVLSLDDVGLSRDGDAYAGTLRTRRQATGIPRQAVAVWITNSVSQAPLQAVGGWLD